MTIQRKAAMICLSGLVAGSIQCMAVVPSSDNPYKQIPERNLFGLISPQPVAVREPIRPPPPQIRLQGITVNLGPTRAIIKIIAPPKPGEPSREQGCTLKVGARDGDLELLEVYPERGAALVRFAGAELLLTLDSGSAK